MRFSTILLLAVLLLGGASKLWAQADTQSKFSLQFDFGWAKTFHRNAPILLIQCREGCNILEQNSRYGQQYHLSTYWAFQPKQALKIGIGRSKYSYNERGLSNTGGGYYFEYHGFNVNHFFTISGGYRITFYDSDWLDLTAEMELLAEARTMKQLFSSEAGVAIQPELAAKAQVLPRLDLSLGVFYKTSLTDFPLHAEGFGPYRPFAYGLQAGLAYQM